MLRIRSVHLWVLSALFLLSRLFGLLAGTRRLHHHQLQCSPYWRLHGYLVLLFVVCFSPYAVHIIYTRTGFLRQHQLLLYVGFYRFPHLLCSTLLMLYMQTSRQRQVVGWINQLLRCRDELHGLLQSSRGLLTSAQELHTRKYVCILYALIVSLICSAAHNISVLFVDGSNPRSLVFFFSVLFFYFCQLSLQICLTLYLLALMLISHLSHHCNLFMAQLLSDAQHSHEQLVTRSWLSRRRLHRRQQLWLALELCRLWRLQCQLMQLSLRLTALQRLQLLVFIVFVPIEWVVHGFFMYFVTHSCWWIRQFHAPATLDPLAITLIIALFTQLVLVITQANQQRLNFQQTLHTLRTGAVEMPHNCGKELLRMLNIYGLYLQQTDRTFHLTACGLFRLNNRLLFGIGQTIISFILILIQFDKIINV